MGTEVDIDDRLLNIVKNRDKKSSEWYMLPADDLYEYVAVTLFAIDAMIQIITFAFLPIADVIVGGIYLNDCPANNNLALSVILVGASGCLFLSLVIWFLVLFFLNEPPCDGKSCLILAPVLSGITFLAAIGLFLYCCNETFKMTKCSETVMDDIERSLVVKNTTDIQLIGNQGNTTTSQLVSNNYTIPTDLSCFTTNETFANTEIYCAGGLYNFAFDDLIAKFVLFFVACVIFGIALCMIFGRSSRVSPDSDIESDRSSRVSPDSDSDIESDRSSRVSPDSDIESEAEQ